jgi:phage tail-like protein
MATFVASLTSPKSNQSAMAVSSILKQGLAYSASTLAETAAFELPKLGATLLVGKYLGIKALPGIGVVNPALSLQILDVGENFIFGSYRPDPSLNQAGQTAGRTDDIKKGASSETKAPVVSFTAKGLQAYSLQFIEGTSAHTDESLSAGYTPYNAQEFPSLRGGPKKNNIVYSLGYIPPSTILSDVDKDTVAAQPRDGGKGEGSEKIVVAAKSARSGTRLSSQPGAGAKIFNSPEPESALYDSMGNLSVRRFSVSYPIESTNADGTPSTSTTNLIEEFAQSYRFFVIDKTPNSEFSVFDWQDGEDPKTLAAGFSSCTAPSMQSVTTDIKEGTWEFTRTFVTGISSGRITLRKGLVRTETGFYLWMLNALRGLLTRRTLEIVSYRGGSIHDGVVFHQAKNLRKFSTCVWTLHNCIPIAYHPSQDWDAENGKVQVSEIEIHYEWFEEKSGNIYPQKNVAS